MIRFSKSGDNLILNIKYQLSHLIAKIVCFSFVKVSIYNEIKNIITFRDKNKTSIFLTTKHEKYFQKKHFDANFKAIGSKLWKK